jgi:hypothetical protein
MAGIDALSMLTARSTMFANVSGGRGNNGLSRADFAGLLSGLDSLHVHYAMAKYMGDEDSESRLVQDVAVWVSDLAEAKGWAGAGEGVLIKAAGVAVFESIRPILCAKCRGVGWLASSSGVLGMGYRPCPGCDCIGYKRLSGRVVAQGLGVTQSSYVRVWSVRYGYCADLMQVVDSKVIVTANKNMNR